MAWHSNTTNGRQESIKERPKTCALSQIIIYGNHYLLRYCPKFHDLNALWARTHVHMQFLAPWASIFGLEFSFVVVVQFYLPFFFSIRSHVNVIERIGCSVCVFVLIKIFNGCFQWQFTWTIPIRFHLLVDSHWSHILLFSISINFGQLSNPIQWSDHDMTKSTH